MASYYNEHDKFAAQWLRELIKAGLIADGEVDDRDIQDVQPADVRGFVQCHFFAGIGGWSAALRLAGWPDDRRVWTGSCPCQPWSVAGSGEGTNDPRHLWPAWFRLIEVCRPPTIFGEQTASEDGRYWLDLVYVDLEARDYAVAAANLPAASQGAPHARARLWFVANTNCERVQDSGHGEVASAQGSMQEAAWQRQRVRVDSEPNSDAVCDCGHRSNVHVYGTQECEACSCASFLSPLVDAHSLRAERIARGEGRQKRATHSRRQTQGRGRIQAVNTGATGGVGNANSAGLAFGSVNEDRPRPIRIEGEAVSQAGATRGFWASCDWVWHRDGVYRAVEPGAFPLAARLPGDVDQIRCFGNAIVPQVAQAFIEAYLDATEGRECLSR